MGDAATTVGVPAKDGAPPWKEERKDPGGPHIQALGGGGAKHIGGVTWREPQGVAPLITAIGLRGCVAPGIISPQYSSLRPLSGRNASDVGDDLILMMM